MTIRTEYPYQTLRIVDQRRGEPGDGPVDRLHAAGRAADGATERSACCRSSRPKLPRPLEAGWPLLVIFTERIFREDREIVEQEQAAHDAQGGDWNQEVFPVIRDLRKLLAERGADTIGA